MKKIKLSFLLGYSASLLLVILLGACSTASGALVETVIAASSIGGDKTEADGEGDGSGEEETSETLIEDEEEEEVGIRIQSDPSDAAVYLNTQYVGRTPVLVAAEPGVHRIRIQKDGYYSAERWVEYRKDSLLIVDVQLEQITGYLHIQTEPKNAEIRVDGVTVGPGVTELPIGYHGLWIRAFGYEPHRTQFRISPLQTTSIEVSLEEASFRVSALSLSRNAFNPSNPGLLGRTRLSYEVSAPGAGVLVVTDAEGSQVWSFESAPYTTWTQAITWDGRDERGVPVPDGTYRMQLTAEGAKAGTIMVESRDVRIDRSIVIAYRPVWSGVSGLLYAPTAEVIPEGSVQFGGLVLGYFEPASGALLAPAQIGLRLPLARGWEIDVAASGLLHSGGNIPYAVGAAVKYLVVSPAMNRTTQFGAHARLTYVDGTNADPLTNYTGLSLGGTLQLSLGTLRIVLSPDLVVSPYWPSYSTTIQEASMHIWAYARAGMLLDLGGVSLGLSGAFRSRPFAQGYDLYLPFAAGLEIHWVIPGTQLVVTGGLAGEYRNESDYYIMGGAGLGLLN